MSDVSAGGMCDDHFTRRPWHPATGQDESARQRVRPPVPFEELGELGRSTRRFDVERRPFDVVVGNPVVPQRGRHRSELPWQMTLLLDLTQVRSPAHATVIALGALLSGQSQRLDDQGDGDDENHGRCDDRRDPPDERCPAETAGKAQRKVHRSAARSATTR
ncbi:hypothetical protein [Calidifontibacter indicus]|uniref:hypothetical protein n=1 Tax=Calidifontibacter indicus TaxID=419650 RepID=UPI003D72F8D4